MIEVGKYVRTRKGIAKIKEKIGKVWDKGIVYEVDKNGTFITDNSFREFIYETDIIKHSKNIIDLIETDDFITLGKNCYPLRVDCIWNNGKELNIKLEGEREFEDIKNDKDFEVYSIVTKEQMAQREYKVKE